MTTLISYLDVSGNQPDQGICTVAGFIAPAEQWDDFSKEWAAVLARFSLAYFHMTDYVARYAPYDTLADDERDALMNALLTVIERHTVASAAYGVTYDMYTSQVPAAVQQVVGRAPYYFLFFNLVSQVERMFDAPARLAAGVPLDWKVVYLLAKGDDGATQIVQAWMSTKPGTVGARREARVASVRVSPDTRLAPFQAADLLAFEVRRQLALQLSGEVVGSRYPFTRMESLRYRAWGFYKNAWHLRANADVVERAMLQKSNRELLTW